MLALSDRAMPLHDTRNAANARSGLSPSFAQVRHRRGRRESVSVRRGDENAREGVSRKVRLTRTKITESFLLAVRRSEKKR